jgi:hypothetical protein
LKSKELFALKVFEQSMFNHITSRLQRFTRDILTSDHKHSSDEDEEDIDNEKSDVESEEQDVVVNSQHVNSYQLDHKNFISKSKDEHNEINKKNLIFHRASSTNSLQDSMDKQRTTQENHDYSSQNSNFLTKLVHKQQEEVPILSFSLGLLRLLNPCLVQHVTIIQCCSFHIRSDMILIM